MGEASAKASTKQGWTSPLVGVAHLLVRFLQALVLGLEQLIEWLGYEPERRWENALFLKGASIKTPSAVVLARRAKVLAENGDGEGALRLYIKVLEAQPDNTLIMDAAAEILTELGDANGAKDLLLRSIELAPEHNHGKYVLLGHLEHGEAAIQLFEKGLQIIHTTMANLGSTTEEGQVLVERKKLKVQLSSITTSIAKVYLTDCFMEKDAPQICERLLDQALLHDPDNPEACQALADLRISQHRCGEGLVLVRRTLEICGNFPAGVAPSYDFRTVTARLLVELSQYDIAVSLLEELVSEDDEDTEVMYLLGLCYMLLNFPKKCRDALLKARNLVERTRTGDTTLLEQINGLLERRTISESEKEHFWNPRWWVGSDRAAKDDAFAQSVGNAACELSVAEDFTASKNGNDIYYKEIPI